MTENREQRPDIRRSDATMAYVEGLERQVELLREDVRGGFAKLHDKMDTMVPRSELDLVRQRYEERINEALEANRLLSDAVSSVKRWLYLMTGGALGGGVGVNQIIERVFM